MTKPSIQETNCYALYFCSIFKLVYKRRITIIYHDHEWIIRKYRKSSLPKVNLSMNLKMRVSTCLWCLLGSLIIKMSIVHANCHVIGAIGGVVEQSSRVGREQKIAMEMVVHDFCRMTNATCSCSVLYLNDSQGNPASLVNEVRDLMEGKQVQAIVGTISPQEARLVAEFHKATKNISIVSLIPTTTSFLPHTAALPYFVQGSQEVKIHIQCIASLVDHFNWQTMTEIYEDHITFSSSPDLLGHPSVALQPCNSTIEQYLTFLPLYSLSNSSSFIEEESKKLKMKKNRVFILLKPSLRSSILPFEKEMHLGMMEKGYVWINSDYISNLLDSVDQSVISTMQGVVGFKTNFAESNQSFGMFKLQSRKKFRNKYPGEEEYLNTSINALHTYDATLAIVKATQVSKGSSSSTKLLESIIHTKFNTLSGEISFKDGKLNQLSNFQLFNCSGRIRGYGAFELLSPEFGFSNDKLVRGEMNLDLINWPGDTQSVPTGQVVRNEGNPLKIGVPAKGAFKQFVNVSYDPEKNRTDVTGFSIQVFKAALKQLSYSMSYDFIPYYGSYDKMVAEVHNKTLDAVVGDTEITADRYAYAQFSQPYMESGLVMVVPVKPSTRQGFIFLYAFTTKMWIILLAMTIGTISVVWLNEHIHGNDDFKASSTFEYISKMLWFAVAVLSLSHREVIKNNLSRLILATWFCVNVIVAACFTATLSSVMTVSRFQPSLRLKSNDIVGCNGNSFIGGYLMDVLHFRHEFIRYYNSSEEYHEAFTKREIAAAFFVSPHADVFLAKYCHNYQKIGTKYKLGGFGFVFPKGSTWEDDISEAVLKLTQNGEIDALQEDMLESISSCFQLAQEENGPRGLGPENFTGIFMISGAISAFVFFIIMGRLAAENKAWIWNLIQSNLMVRRTGNWIAVLLQMRVLYRDPSVELTPNQVATL